MIFSTQMTGKKKKIDAQAGVQVGGSQTLPRVGGSRGSSACSSEQHSLYSVSRHSITPKDSDGTARPQSPGFLPKLGVDNPLTLDQQVLFFPCKV